MSRSLGSTNAYYLHPMESYARLLTYAIPAFLALIVLESVIARMRGMRINQGADTISSLGSGITNIVKDVLGLSVAIVSYDWMAGHLALVRLEATWQLYLVAFIVKDFAGYWMHRFEHKVNFLWNRHIIHHSSEEFNLSCALRQSISSVFVFITLFMVPAALLGVPAEVFAIVSPLHLFAQFWYHTRVIGRMGWLEMILVTPSHHRVHHAMNPPYLDRNYGQVLILWDRLFGTFQPELDHTPPVYGVSRPVRTWNPILINFQHLARMVQDAWHTRSLADKLRIWFMPTGWRPADVASAHPVYNVKEFESFEKYDSDPSPALLGYAWVQLALTLVLTLWIFSRLAAFSMPELLAAGGFLILSVAAFTAALDRHPIAIPLTAALPAFSCFMLWVQQGDWYGLSSLGVFAPWSLLTAQMLSLIFLTMPGRFMPYRAASASPAPPGRA